MAAETLQILCPENLPDLFAVWAKAPSAFPFAGGTTFLGFQGTRKPYLPSAVISLAAIADLQKISRTERYIEIGAMVTLNSILNLRKIVPEILTAAIEGIGAHQLRNLATIGGNICNQAMEMDITAAMLALDASYELRSAEGSRWVQAARFSLSSGSVPLAPQELLTRIRVPLQQWDYTRYQKFGCGTEDAPYGNAVFIMQNQKRTLNELRIVYSGALNLRDKNSEAILEGRQLPLDKKDVRTFMDHWTSYLEQVQGLGAFPKTKLINFVESNLLSFADY
ncbi:FAD-binding protein [Spirochaetia bacterium]|nr:FAD-binding protein [Spirochaetia bacterium]